MSGDGECGECGKCGKFRKCGELGLGYGFNCLASFYLDEQLFILTSFGIYPSEYIQLLTVTWLVWTNNSFSSVIELVLWRLINKGLSAVLVGDLFFCL